MVTEAQVLDAMRHIIDPDLGRDIVSLGFIKNLAIDGGTVSFTLELTTPACPVKEKFKDECARSVGALDGVQSVDVAFSAMEVQKRPRPAVNSLVNVDTVLAVSSCKGGVGKSTMAAQLAWRMAEDGLRVGLLDADVYGPSVPTLFQMHRPAMHMRENMLIPMEVGKLKIMSMGFVLGESPAVLRGPMVSGYVQQILQQTAWGELDYLIVDMPPGTGDIQLTLVQQAAFDGAIIVTTPQALSLVDVARGILMFEKVKVPVLGIVENMSFFVCDQCDKRHAIFGDSTATLQERFGLPTLAQFPIVQGASNMLQAAEGVLAECIRTLTDNVHREIGKRRVAPEANPAISEEEGFIVVKWPEGGEDRFPNKLVRASCQCAVCVDEYSRKKLLDDASIPDDIVAKGIEPLGNYAVGILWSDGHSSGIFSWDHFRRLKKSVAG